MNAAAHETVADLDQFDDLLVVRPRTLALPDTEIDITPMIDMVFLLLIFFLVTSRLAQQSSVELPAARYGGAISAKEAAIVTIAQDGDEAAIFKGDSIDPAQRMAMGDPAAAEAELIAYLQSELRDGSAKRHVLIKAGKEVKHKHVARVSQAVGRVLGRGRLYVAVRESPTP
jgi:biopolymer transport protein ExbD